MTFGSLLSIGALAVLRGPRLVLTALIEPERAPFTVAYVGSLALTLYATVATSSYLLVLFSVLVQVGWLASLRLSARCVWCPPYPPLHSRLPAAARVVQICALAYFASTFVPGGIGGMNMMSRFALAAAAASTRSLAAAATR